VPVSAFSALPDRAIVLPNKRMAGIARRKLENADKTNPSRFLAGTLWQLVGLAQHPVTKAIGHIEGSVSTAILAYLLLLWL
jgi:hypothetical protein